MKFEKVGKNRFRVLKDDNFVGLVDDGVTLFSLPIKLTSSDLHELAEFMELVEIRGKVQHYVY